MRRSARLCHSKKKQDEERKQDANHHQHTNNAVLISHPYLNEKYLQRKFTLSTVQREEDRILLSLMERSNWRSSPLTPSLSMPSSNNGYYERCPLSQRVVALRLTDRDNIFGNTMDRIPGYGVHQAHWPPSLWTMPPSVAVLDRIREMTLYRCTGAVPPTTGKYLTLLEALYLNACSNLDLSTALGSELSKDNGYGSHHHNGNKNAIWKNLKILKVLDCENVTPQTFRWLTGLQTLAFIRWNKHNTNTHNLGNRWIQELAAVDHDQTHDHTLTVPLQLPVRGVRLWFGFQTTLQSLSFRDANLTNEDLQTIFWKILPGFPALEKLSVTRNAEINSFQKAMEIPPGAAPTTAGSMSGLMVSDYVSERAKSSNLKSLEMLHTKISWTMVEVESLVCFLETIGSSVGTLDIFSLWTTPRYNGGPSNPKISNLKDRAQTIEYLLARNATNTCSLLTGGNDLKLKFVSSDDAKDTATSRATTKTNTQPTNANSCRRSPPRALWPLALAKTYARGYSIFNESNGAFSVKTSSSNIPFAIAYDFLRHGSIFSTGQTKSWCKRKREFIPRTVKKRIQYPK